LNQAKGFLSTVPQQTPVEKKILFFICHRAESKGKNSLHLTCLGRITTNILLGAALTGFDEVVLIKGICSQCRFQQGEKSITNSITASRIVLESAGLSQFTISIEEKEKKKEAMLSRRDVFLNISNKVKTKTASLLHHGEKTIRNKLTVIPENKQDKRLSPARKMLLSLLDQTRLKNGNSAHYTPDFPWGKIIIEEHSCSVCGICLAVCPTGAIYKKIKHEQHYFCFNSSLCNNCSLCKAACPENAIDFEDNFSLVAILKEQPGVVAKITMTSCIICGEVITTKKPAVCPTCQKRQVSPMHLSKKEEKCLPAD
jgi:ferredoxin/coenzyme F420-reducing hydrogenase delta subunit